jgi:hypothetical protein
MSTKYYKVKKFNINIWYIFDMVEAGSWPKSPNL